MRLTHVGAPPKNRNDWHTIRSLLPYVWQYKNRVILALSCLILAKLANVAVPMFLKQVVDYFQSKTASELMIVVPTLAIFGYGLLRFASSALGELRDAVFAKVAQGAVRKVALEVFVHLHSMSLRFHLNRQTGGMTRDIERGTRGISFLLNFMLFNIIPTLVEIVLVAVVLLAKYDAWFAIVTFASLAIYIAFTLGVTEWRMVFRRTMNQLDSTANNKAIDALINYETVKYFGNERFESKRYDHNLEKWETAAVKNQTSLALLNAGQALIIAVGVTILMWLAARGVANKTMTIGDLVLVNAFMIQLYIPLNFLGFVYREIRHSLADMEKMFDLLAAPAEIQDADDAIPLATRDAQVQFQNVHFHYETDREILFGVDFTIPAGKTLAVVGTSGAGKSTLSRLLYRFYDVTQGAILINGTDIRALSQDSLRAHIGIVPQDTVLFNDSIGYNIAYGCTDATQAEIEAAARAASIHDFVVSLPQGYDTTVGERGLKLSGGEKQRVAIARTLLKNPPILVLDEATSALDSRTEQAIQAELMHIAASRTTLVIAHRLSTVVGADEIIVLEGGKIVERGTHVDLLSQQGVYTRLWAMQQRDDEPA